jgi:hypothetical protein
VRANSTGTLLWLAALIVGASCRRADPDRREQSAVAVVDRAAMAGRSASSAPTAPAAPAAPADAAPITTSVPTEAAAPSEADWLPARLRNARAGVVEVVSVPVWKCGPSCTCPGQCFIVRAPEGVFGVHFTGEPPALGDWSEGTFFVKLTGRVLKQPAGGGEGPLEDVYEVTLVAQGREPPPDLDDPDRHCRIALAGPTAMITPPLLEGDKPWFVIAKTVPGWPAPDLSALEEIAARMRASGFPAAAIVDSRSAPRLSCCFQVIVADRFATASEAESERKRLVAAKVAGVPSSAYVVRGF